jgi:hypothetical protein
MKVNPPIPSQPAGLPRRAARWLLPAALLALTPKCLLCVLAYAGLGAALGIGGLEICGAPGGSPAFWESSQVWLGFAGVLGMFGILASYRRARPAPTANRTSLTSASTHVV